MKQKQTREKLSQGCFWAQIWVSAAGVTAEKQSLQAQSQPLSPAPGHTELIKIVSNMKGWSIFIED